VSAGTAALANNSNRVYLCVKMTRVNGIPERPSSYLSGPKKTCKGAPQNVNFLEFKKRTPIVTVAL